MILMRSPSSQSRYNFVSGPSSGLEMEVPLDSVNVGPGVCPTHKTCDGHSNSSNLIRQLWVIHLHTTEIKLTYQLNCQTSSLPAKTALAEQTPVEERTSPLVHLVYLYTALTAQTRSVTFPDAHAYCAAGNTWLGHSDMPTVYKCSSSECWGRAASIEKSVK